MNTIQYPKGFSPYKSFQKQPSLWISDCLLGKSVRYDGQHKDAGELIDHLHPYVSITGVCPEVASGMGIPRPPVKIVKTHDQQRVLGRDEPELDVTERLTLTAQELVSQCLHLGVAGALLKSKSPSCGHQSTEIHLANQGTFELGDGIFVQTAKRLYPTFCIANESELADESVRHRFLQRLFLHQDWLQLINSPTILSTDSIGQWQQHHVAQGINESMVAHFSQFIDTHSI